MQANYLYVEDLAVSYGKDKSLIKVVDGLDLSLGQGEIGCFLGYSGCGKTTALRAIAGLEPVQRGQVLLDQKELTQGSFFIPPARRDMGMVFQDYALFGHLTVAENVGFGLHRYSNEKRKARVTEMLDLVKLGKHSHKKPAQLSGGQQQRVALARALAPEPKLLLLDEPFSNLDVVLRESLAMNVRNILKQTDTTAILVTHDQNEAFALADKVGVMHQGKLVQWATPSELYHEPKTTFVADFIGEGVMLNGRVENGNLHTPLGSINIKENKDVTFFNGKNVKLLIRPDDVIHDDESQASAKVIARVFRGANYLYQLELEDGQYVYSLVPSHHDHAIGSSIGIVADLKHLVIFETN